MPFGYWVPKLVRGRGHPHAGERERRRVQRLPRLRALARHPGRAARSREGVRRRGARALGRRCARSACSPPAPRWSATRVPSSFVFRRAGRWLRPPAARPLALAPLAACHLHRGLARRLRRHSLRVARVARDRARARRPRVVFDYPWPIVAFGIAGAAAVIVLHRQNIRRLLGGTEHRFELGALS